MANDPPAAADSTASTPHAFDREAARRHCLLLAKGDQNERFVFQAFADRPEDKGDKSLVGTRYGTFDEVAGWLEEMNGRKAGIFITVNQTSGAGRTDGDIIGVRAFFYDHDEKDGPMRAASPLPGSLIVRSGHGSHCYYLLEQVASPAAFTAIQTAIASKLGTDSKVTDRPRVMRLAGSVNWKFEPVPVVIVESHPGRTYTVEQVATAFGVDPASLGSGSPPRRERPKITTDPTADHQAIRAGCAWFNGLFTNPQDADEQQWFAGLRVVACCVDAETVAQEMSSGHKDYTEAETSAKLARAQGYEPLTCSIINDKLGFAGCDSCPHRWRIKSPIDLGRDNEAEVEAAKRLALEKVMALEAGRAADFQKVETFVALAKLEQDDRDALMIRVRAYIASNRRSGLSRKDVEERLKAALRARKRSSERQSASGLPAVVVSQVQLRDAADSAMTALVAANDGTPSDFVRGVKLVRVVTASDDGAPIIQEHAVATMRGRLTRVADFLRHDMNGNLVGCSPTKDIVEEVLHRAEYVDLPILAGVTTVPIARDDGSFHTAPGYDRDTGLYLVINGDPVEYNIAAIPSATDVQQAVGALRAVFVDFPLVGESGFAHVVSLLLTLLLRARFRDSCPLFLVRATSPGTGKTLLMSVCCLIVLGIDQIDSFPPADKDDEMRKRITTAVLEGRPVIAIDNVDGLISSAALASFITTPMWSDRRLGVNSTVRSPNRATTILNGNNTTCPEDLLRRLHLIQLHYPGEHPEDRHDFQIPNLLPWVRLHRHELLAALLILVRHYHASGKPLPPDLKPFGGFDTWNATIGGILYAAGITGFRADAELRSDLDDGIKSQWAGFLRAIFLWSWGEPFTAADLANQLPDHRGATVPRAFPLLLDTLPTNLAARQDRGQGTFNHALGQGFKSMANAMLKGFAVEPAGNDPASHVKRWRVRCHDLSMLPDLARITLHILDLIAASGWWTAHPDRRPEHDRASFRTLISSSAVATGINLYQRLPARNDPDFQAALRSWIWPFISACHPEQPEESCAVTEHTAIKDALTNDLVARILALPLGG